jgi:ribonucleoside-diphosphate reductase alpha chain
VAGMTELPQETLDWFEGDELRARVFFEKYALQDIDGMPLELTPEEMWERIAKGLAEVEETEEKRREWYEKFRWLLSNFRFVPGGRIMHAVGNPRKVTPFNCFPAGTKVLTRDGLKPIEAVRAGDEVLTHRNRFRKVTHVIAREIDEPLCELRLWYLNDAPIRCTQDHLFLCLEGEQVKWVPAAAITPQHYIKLGRIDEDLPVAELDIAKFVSHLPIQEDEGERLFTAVTYIGGNGAVGVAQSRRVRRKIRIDERFGLWLGYFIAEGGITEHSVYFTFSKDESDYAQEVATLTEELFGVSANIQWREGQEGHWLRVWANSNLLAAFLRQFFPDGVHTHEKRLPSWFLMAPKSVQRAFIAGLFRGDGTEEEGGYDLCLANPDLIRQVWLILLRLGVLASLRWETPSPHTQHPTMRLGIHSRPFVDALRRWISGDFDFEAPPTETPTNYFYRVKDGEVFVKVKSVRLTERRQEVVYDLTVEDDHSFTAEFACAHNCFVLPIKDDSLEAIFECAKEMARTYSQGGGVGIDISVLRPAGSPVRNAARTSTGAVSFMELYSMVTGTIGQHGRRGALMITIADNHPDVLAFIDIKNDPERRRVRYANISVRVSDELMEAVQRNGKFELRFDGEYFSIRRTVDAREIWDKLIQNAWACVPYDTLLFVWKDGKRQLMRIGDLVKEWHANPKVHYEVLSLNLETLQLERKPITKVYEFANDKRLYEAETESGKVFVATEDHLVYRLTPEGSIESVPVSALRPGDFVAIAKTTEKDEAKDERAAWVDLRDQWQTLAAFGHGLTGEPIIQLLQTPRVRHLLGKFPSGKAWRADEYLRVGYLPVKEAVRLRAQGVEIPADGVFWKPCRRQDLQLPLRFPVDETLAEFLGLWLAEGSIRKNGLRLYLHLEEAKELQPLLEEIARRFNAKWVWERQAGNWVGLRIDCTALRLTLQALGIYQNGQKVVPSFLAEAPIPIIAAFLRGYFSGDGCVRKRGMISVSSVSRSILESVQRLLLLLGIHSRLGLAQRGKEKVINGKVCRARDTYRLTIYQGYNALFAQRLGFLLRRKQETLEQGYAGSPTTLVGLPMIVNFALFYRTLGRFARERVAPATIFQHPSLLANFAIRRLLTAGVQWEKIIRVRPARKQVKRVYDITVADNHTFVIANGWVISNSAEPGCLFWSTIKRYSTSEYNGMEVISTNPCVTGDTLVSTDEGLIPIAELAERNRLPHAILDGRVSPHFHTGAIIKAWWSGRKPVYRVVTRAGYEVRATADHKILTANRGWVQVKDLQPGDLLLIQNRKGGFGRYGDEHLGRILGWLVADGHVNHHDNRAVLDFYAQDRELAPAFAQSVAAVIPTSQRYPAPSVVAVPSQERVQIRSRRLLEKLVELGFDPAEKHTIPAVVWQGSEAMVRGFLQALFTADGTVQSSTKSRFSVRLTSTNLRFLKDVQILLAHFGIASRIYENRRPEGAKLMPDGRGGVKLYGTQPVHELVIGRENIVRFYREIGFLPGSEKQKKLEQIVKSYERGPYRETFTTPVVEVIPEGVEDVYDLTEAVSHTFIANGLTVANCGEEPLPAYGNCNLGNINLSAFVLDEFTDAARVDWESLEKAVRYAVRFLDNVITYAVKEDRLPLPQQKERCAAERRIGVGFTGLGDILAQLRLKYDTDDALEFVDELFHKIKCWAYDESVNLAIERGPFPLFDPEKHLQMGFIRERLPRELQEKIRRHGIRNVCVLTVPPVGSGAAMAGVTSGIEPIFALSYIRRSESLSKGEFKVFHPCVRRYMEKFGIDDERDLPDFFVTAHQIIPEMRVRMQAIIQSHIDQSISSTINLPHDITTQEVERIYFLAWRLGCKGITVYREGSREGVLITEEFAQQKRGRLMPKPRPMVMVGKTYKLRTEMGNVYVTVNADEEGPQEVFVRLGKSGSSAMAFTEAIGRLISLALRAGVSPDAIVDQLSGIKSSSATRQENGTIVFSVPDAVAKALEMFLKGENSPKSSALTEVLLQALTENNETELAVPPISSIREELPQILQANGARYSGDLCPNCGEPLIHSGGCELCLFCGYSRCQ